MSVRPSSVYRVILPVSLIDAEIGQRYQADRTLYLAPEMFDKQCDNTLDPTQNFGCAGVRPQDLVLTSPQWLESDLDDMGASSLI